ncbi:hypothetical protein N9K77_01715, partial [bacterium]|nr:hypothetical protein [bacterium]
CLVPNVYGMSQFADGGLMSTKPYISGSNYIVKMSDYKKGEWCKIWDALFWNFMDKQRAFFLKNPRMRMLISSFDKMDPSKRETHLITACFNAFSFVWGGASTKPSGEVIAILSL